MLEWVMDCLGNVLRGLDIVSIKFRSLCLYFCSFSVSTKTTFVDVENKSTTVQKAQENMHFHSMIALLVSLVVATSAQ
jgi:hypothetical protein